MVWFFKCRVTFPEPICSSAFSSFRPKCVHTIKERRRKTGMRHIPAITGMLEGQFVGVELMWTTGGVPVVHIQGSRCFPKLIWVPAAQQLKRHSKVVSSDQNAVSRMIVFLFSGSGMARSAWTSCLLRLKSKEDGGVLTFPSISWWFWAFRFSFCL